MKKAGDLQLGEKFTYNGCHWMVVDKDESSGHVTALCCDEMSLTERARRFGWPKTSTDHKDLIQALMKPLLDDLKKEMEAQQ